MPLSFLAGSMSRAMYWCIYVMMYLFSKGRAPTSKHTIILPGLGLAHEGTILVSSWNYTLKYHRTLWSRWKRPKATRLVVAKLSDRGLEFSSPGTSLILAKRHANSYTQGDASGPDYSLPTTRVTVVFVLHCTPRTTTKMHFIPHSSLCGDNLCWPITCHIL